MKIEVEIEQEDLIDRVASLIAFNAQYVDSDSPVPRPASTLANTIQEAVRDRVRIEIDKEIKAAIKKITDECIQVAVKEAVAEGWKKTDTFGHPIGPVMSVKDRINEILKEGGSNSYGNQKSRIDQLAKETIENLLKTEFAEEIKAAREQFKQLLDKGIYSKVVDAVKSAMGIPA